MGEAALQAGLTQDGLHQLELKRHRPRSVNFELHLDGEATEDIARRVEVGRFEVEVGQVRIARAHHVRSELVAAHADRAGWEGALHHDLAARCHVRAQILAKHALAAAAAGARQIADGRLGDEVADRHGGQHDAACRALLAYLAMTALLVLLETVSTEDVTVGALHDVPVGQVHAKWAVELGHRIAVCLRGGTAAATRHG
mmetsp:Transcript_13148/g.26435  ORF Transcript_13148/g.26435 Transcript_13148/m.26435 type:complete len:200 (-) Transcript_13148:78-677(-)